VVRIEETKGHRFDIGLRFSFKEMDKEACHQIAGFLKDYSYMSYSSGRKTKRHISSPLLKKSEQQSTSVANKKPADFR